MRDGDTYEVPVGLEEYDCVGLTTCTNSDVYILWVGGFDPVCKQPREHLMAGIDNVCNPLRRVLLASTG